MIGGLVQLLLVLAELGFRAAQKNRLAEAIGAAGPGIRGAITAMSRTVGETEEETRVRLAQHDELVAEFGAGPPPGIKGPE